MGLQGSEWVVSSSLHRSRHLARGERRGSAEEREGFPERQAVRIRRCCSRVVCAVVVLTGSFPRRASAFPWRASAVKAVSGANRLLHPTQLPEEPEF